MSCYEWERGTIKIPSKDWAGLKAAVRNQYNQKQEFGFAMALAMYYHLKETLKGRRNQHLLARDALEDAENKGFTVTDSALKDTAFNPKLLGGGNWKFRVSPGKHAEEHDFWCDVKNSVLAVKDGKLTLKKPTKKDWAKATNKDRVFRIDDADIIFSDDKQKTVTWDVQDNNHAVERARRHSLAKALFHALDKIQWTRGSGGEIVGNNEYNRDDCSAGGGANYVSESYGPDRNERKYPKRGVMLPRSGGLMNRRY